MARLIMVVNANQNILDAYHDTLTIEDFEVSERLLNQTKMEDIEKIKPDLIITDLKFGEERANLQWLQCLRSDLANKNIPIIICTGPESQSQAVKNYASALNIPIITKPFHLEDLLTEINKALAG